MLPPWVEKGNYTLTQLGGIPIERYPNLTGRVKQVIIKQEINRQWYAIFTVEERVSTKPSPVSIAEIGIDRGLKVFAALSNGEMIDNPRFLRRKEKQLRRAQRQLSRKQKGSNHARKQKARVQQLHSKVKKQRKDFLHKRTTELANKYGLIAIEDLKIQSMIRSWRFRRVLPMRVRECLLRCLTTKPEIAANYWSKWPPTTPWVPSSQDLMQNFWRCLLSKLPRIHWKASIHDPK
jgi:transposase